MKSLFTFMLLVMATLSSAQVKVSDNQRFLQAADGKPFFWLGDTCWELFHRLTREEIDEFLEIRKSQGFNVIQAVALAEFDGLRQPNRYGDWPLNNEDPTQLLVTPGSDPKNDYEYDYWDHIDYAIDKMAEKGMMVGLLPTWGDKVAHMWGQGPVVFDEKNAEVYARNLANRYQGRKNVIWILGGDRPAIYKYKRDGVEKDYNDVKIWRAMADAIESVLGREALITYHPSGGQTSSTDLHAEPWLDMNAFQSGHGARESESWKIVSNDLSLNPPKPVLDMEPCYEDHPVNPWDGKWTRARGYFTAYDVRARNYRSVFAGGCGVTYGHHHIWQFTNPDLYKPVNTGDTIILWRNAARAEAAGQMQHLKNLMLSRPYFSRVPDQSIIISNPGKDYRDLIVATRDSGSSYAFIYLPQSKEVKIDLSKISGPSKNIWWFDPRSGKAISGKQVKGQSASLKPPAGGTDWVLVIDDASKGFGAPGN